MYHEKSTLYFIKYGSSFSQWSGLLELVPKFLKQSPVWRSLSNISKNGENESQSILFETLNFEKPKLI